MNPDARKPVPPDNLIRLSRLRKRIDYTERTYSTSAVIALRHSHEPSYFWNNPRMLGCRHLATPLQSPQCPEIETSLDLVSPARVTTLSRALLQLRGFWHREARTEFSGGTPPWRVTSPLRHSRLFVWDGRRARRGLAFVLLGAFPFRAAGPLPGEASPSRPW